MSVAGEERSPRVCIGVSARAVGQFGKQLAAPFEREPTRAVGRLNVLLGGCTAERDRERETSLSSSLLLSTTPAAHQHRRPATLFCSSILVPLSVCLLQSVSAAPSAIVCFTIHSLGPAPPPLHIIDCIDSVFYTSNFAALACLRTQLRRTVYYL